MKRLCLDTSAYTHFRLGDPKVTKIISEARSIGVPVVVLGELRSGFRLGKRHQENEKALRAFLENPVVKCLDVDTDAADCYAEIYTVLRQQGTPIPSNDMWIAAIAMRDASTVLTYDSDFVRIPQLAKIIL